MGEVAEWSKANDSKSFNRSTIRGFESHPLRPILNCQFKDDKFINISLSL